MKKEVFLWPQPAPLNWRHFLPGAPSHADIETRLRLLYPAAEPVLFSSARAGLRAVLVHLGLTRPDLVWCPPFSSHCVFDAIARIATPTTESHTQLKAALLFHQWGHVHTHSFPAGVTIIEDAVDTLFVPGTDPFAGDGSFVLWSLPKVIASHWGGVVFCRSASVAQSLRGERDRASTPVALQGALRLLGARHPVAAHYWHGAECGSGPLPAFARNNIATRLEELPRLVELRQQQLAACQAFSLIPPGASNRLPSNLPLPADLASGDFGQLALTAGVRSFNMARTGPECDWKRVLPLPIHQDTNGTDIAEMLTSLVTSRHFSPDEPDIF